MKRERKREREKGSREFLKKYYERHCSRSVILQFFDDKENFGNAIISTIFIKL